MRRCVGIRAARRFQRRSFCTRAHKCAETQNTHARKMLTETRLTYIARSQAASCTRTHKCTHTCIHTLRTRHLSIAQRELAHHKLRSALSGLESIESVKAWIDIPLVGGVKARDGRTACGGVELTYLHNTPPRGKATNSFITTCAFRGACV